MQVLLLLNVEVGGISSIELLGNRVGGVVQLLEKVGLQSCQLYFESLFGTGTYGDGEVIAASELSDLANVAERSAHDDGLVAVLLVVVENGAHGLDTGVFVLGVLLLVVGLVPIKDATDERRDEESTGLGGGNGLRKGEHECQVAVDAVLGLQNVGGLDSLVGRGNLDQNAGLVNSLCLVQLLAHLSALLQVIRRFRAYVRR